MRPTGMPLLTLPNGGTRPARASAVRFRRTRFSISGTSKSSAEIFPPSTLSKIQTSQMPPALPWCRPPVRPRRRNAPLPSLSFRCGLFNDRLSDPAASDLWPSTGPLSISIAGSQTVDIGAAQADPRTKPSENRFQFVDNYNWTHGAHSLKFGADAQTTLEYVDQL